MSAPRATQICLKVVLVLLFLLFYFCLLICSHCAQLKLHNRNADVILTRACLSLTRIEWKEQQQQQREACPSYQCSESAQRTASYLCRTHTNAIARQAANDSGIASWKHFEEFSFNCLCASRFLPPQIAADWLMALSSRWLILHLALPWLITLITRLIKHLSLYLMGSQRAPFACQFCVRVCVGNAVANELPT